jgi:arylsulfatase A-like enzyme
MSLPFVSADEITTVVLVVSDSLRADIAAKRMPYLQQLADESVSFESCYAVGPNTPSSMSGMMQSRLPIDGGYGSVLLRDVPTLGEALDAAGVTCGGWHCNPHTLTERGFDRGFDVYSDLLTQPPQYRPGEETDTSATSSGTWRQKIQRIADQLGVRDYVDELSEMAKRRGYLTTDPRVPAKQAVDAFETWFADLSGNSQFAYLHFMDTHMPYDPPESQWETSDLEKISSRRAHVLYQRMKDAERELSNEEIADLRRLYEVEAEYVDSEIERIIDILKSEGEWDSSVVLFTSDHGELFGERTSPNGERVDHPSYLCEEITHVPLVIAGGTVSSCSYKPPVSGMDVAPTIVQAFDITQPDTWEGKPLVRFDVDSFQEAKRQQSAKKERGYAMSAVASPPGSVTDIDPDWLHLSVRSKQRAVLWWRNNTPTEYYCRKRSEEIKDDDPEPSDYQAETSIVESYKDIEINPEPRLEREERVAEKRLKNLGYIN